MAVTQVVIDNVTPGTDDVDIQWESDQTATTAMVYLADNQADLADPAKRIEGVLPSPVLDSVFRLVIPNVAAGETPLNPGTQYFCQAECDGIMSPIESFTTVAVDVVHLRRPDADPKRIKANGGVSDLTVYVRKNKQGVPGTQVTFTLPSGCNGKLGPNGGPPTGSSYQASSDANGRAEAEFTSGSDKGKFKIAVDAAGAPNPRKIKVRVRN